jgi:drug efflux transport system permease protein
VSSQRTLAIARKELRHILRDSRSLIMALAVPLLMLLLFGFALSLDVDRIPTVVWDQDRSMESRELIQRFQSSRFFQMAGAVTGYPAIERGVARNQLILAVVIPPDYSKRVLSGQAAQVQLLLDGSDSNTASLAMAYGETVIRDEAMRLAVGHTNHPGDPSESSSTPAVPFDVRARIWYNSALISRNYVVPGLVAVILMIIAALLTSLTVAREWEIGTMEQLLSTPLRPSELVLGKMLAFFGVGMVDMLISVAVGVYVFGVPFRGSLLLLFVTGSVFLTGSLFWGIFLSAALRSQLLAYQLSMITSFLPALMLSGFIYSIRNMPMAIQWLTRIIPARYFVTILTAIFLKGVGLEVLWAEALFLLAFASIVFFLATRTMGRKLA